MPWVLFSQLSLPPLVPSLLPRRLPLLPRRLPLVAAIHSVVLFRLVTLRGKVTAWHLKAFAVALTLSWPTLLSPAVRQSLHNPPHSEISYLSAQPSRPCPQPGALPQGKTGIATLTNTAKLPHQNLQEKHAFCIPIPTFAPKRRAKTLSAALTIRVPTILAAVPLRRVSQP